MLHTSVNSYLIPSTQLKARYPPSSSSIPGSSRVPCTEVSPEGRRFLTSSLQPSLPLTHIPTQAMKVTQLSEMRWGRGSHSVRPMITKELKRSLHVEDTVGNGGVHVGLTRREFQLTTARVDEVVPELPYFSTEAQIQITMRPPAFEPLLTNSVPTAHPSDQVGSTKHVCSLDPACCLPVYNPCFCHKCFNKH